MAKPRAEYVPLPFTIPVDSAETVHRRRRANDAAEKKAAAREGRKMRHFGYSDARPKPVIAIEAPHGPFRQRSIIDLVYCRVCRQYQLEGSKALGYCRTCGTVNGNERLITSTQRRS